LIEIDIIIIIMRVNIFVDNNSLYLQFNI